MEFVASHAIADQFIHAGRVSRAGRASEFYRAAKAGAFRRLAHGVYLPAAEWDGLDDDQRFRARIHAAASASRPGLVFSHHSAAALWRLPMVGRWPARPEVLVRDHRGGRSRRAFAARVGADPADTDMIDGLSVTSLARTVIDVGRSAPLATSVAMADHALAVKGWSEVGLRAAMVGMPELAQEFSEIGSSFGRARCRLMLDLADGLSGSPGESLSRVNFHLLGVPAPILQQEFRDARGLIGLADFWWPEYNLIGEFDGESKYLDPELRGGRSAEEVVVAEKVREDRLRAAGPRVVRWGWSVARSLPRLGALLREAGLPARR